MSTDGLAAFVVLAVGALCGCNVEHASLADVPATLHVNVSNVDSNPIAGALVTLTIDSVDQQLTTDMNGSAVFGEKPQGSVTISIVADEFEPKTFPAVLGPGAQIYGIKLDAVGAWAVGRAFVLGTQVLERSSTGSSMTFAVDIAVVDAHSQALLTLTSADFSIGVMGCSAPRSCAADAAGQATGPNGGVYQFEPAPRTFALQPPTARRPYLVEVLAERSAAITDWAERKPALQSFFSTVGGNDTASLTSVEGDAPTATVLAPFGSDAATHAAAIDALGASTGPTPPMLAAVSESIGRAAMARDVSGAGADPTVVVLTAAGLAVTEIDTMTALAQQLGVRVSTLDYRAYGFPEVAVRTSGFTVHLDDARQLPMVLGALDQVLAGTLPFYRMEFRLQGGIDTFVPGGNVKVRIDVDVPTSIPSRGPSALIDLAIP